MHAEFEAVIGLEVHVQLLTATKAFCRCSTVYGASPNTNTCPVCLGHPGCLPVLNNNVVEYTLRMGLATNCNIRPVSTFSRKNYFYPDLPKGYQISQYEDPICYDGHVEIELDGAKKKIGITRIHMEEDAGKSIHDLDIDTLVDLNRSGVPLIEIVSEPDIRTPQEAYKYLAHIRQTVMYLGICDGNMEEGSLRCDANVSVRPKGDNKLYTRTEVKNLNSFRNVEKALEYEIQRQIELTKSGGEVKQITLMWDAGKQQTREMRTKEKAHDYRYFPEPDLTPVHVSEAWIHRVKHELPELPGAKRDRFKNQYGLPEYDAAVLVEEKSLAAYFEECCEFLAEKSKDRFKLVSNWVMTEVMRIMSDRKIEAQETGVQPRLLAELVDLFAADVISSKIAKEIFPDVLKGESPKEIVEKRGLAQVSDTGMIDELVVNFLKENADKVAEYKAGRTNLFGFMVGTVLKATQGKGNPRLVTETLKKHLEQA